MKQTKVLVILLTICLFTTSCSNINKVLKSNDYEAKYDAAMRYYNENQYSKAIQLLENLVMHYRGKDHSENILWSYATSLMKEEDYYTAAYQFKRFTKQYPYSDKVEEAAYLSAYCKYQESPSYSLDQSHTREAVKEFEQFAERYPKSIHIPEVNGFLDEMREKLMRKDYEIAYGYYQIEAYHAAYVSLGSFVNLYPDSEYKEDALFYQLDASYRYASNSTESKIKERMEQTLNDFEKFATLYPQSKYIEKARTIYTKGRAILTDIEKGER